MTDAPLGIDNQSVDLRNSEPHTTNAEKLKLYQNPDYVSLYRYENPSGNPYDTNREGVVSKIDLVGAWFTNNLTDLKTYTRMRMKGRRGGKFIVVRVRKDELDKYDATKKPDTMGMDIEAGNYIIPPEVAQSSSVEVEGVFKDEWEGKRNLDTTQWGVIGDYINQNLSDAALIERLRN